MMILMLLVCLKSQSSSIRTTQSTCKSCGKGAHYGYNCPSKVQIISNSEPFRDQNIKEFPQTLPSFHPTCYIGDENSFAYDSTPKLIKDSPNVFNPPSQPPMIDSLLDEFAGELIILKSIPPKIDEADCDPEEEIRRIEKWLYDNSSRGPPEEFISKNSDSAIKYFSPSPIPVEDSDSLRDEIDLSITLDDSMPPGIKNDDYGSEGDILIFKELLSNDSLSLPENKSFHFDIPSPPRPPAKHRIMMILSPIQKF
nr:hypothetical protein [Tanacetum cinerariifolium]